MTQRHKRKTGENRETKRKQENKHEKKREKPEDLYPTCTYTI
jgi:hypothetical protein